MSIVLKLRNSGLVLHSRNALGKKCILIWELEDARSSERWGVGMKHLIRGNSGEKEEFLGARAKDAQKVEGRR